MMYKKKKSISVLFSFLMIFFIYCFCINLPSERMKNDSEAISQIDDREQVVIMENENSNMENGYYCSVDNAFLFCYNVRKDLYIKSR